MKYDFSGYATKNDLLCADGRIIRKDAFKENDGKTVPLVWQHMHDSPENVLGHAVLENRDDGVYAYCSFNSSDMAQNAKTLVEHGDVGSLSIYANRLKQNGKNVVHGIIREVSLVLAGANPGALIDNLSFAHGDGSYTESEDEAIIYTGLELSAMAHTDNDGASSGKDDSNKTDDSNKEKTVGDVWNSMTDKQKNVIYFIIGSFLEGNDKEQIQNETVSHADGDEDGDTVQDVFDSMTKEQKQLAYAIIGEALEDAENDENDENDNDVQHGDLEGDNFMKYNVFDNTSENEKDLSHAEIEAVFNDAKRIGSLKDAFIEHGIENIDYLFPDARTVTTQPELIVRPQEWVEKVWNATHKSPFSRIKSVAADLTADDARAKGYIKGNQKVEEQFKLLKRVTTPQTVYKIQKLDRDDVLDIVDFDVVVWMKSEMRMMLNEELSRAVLVGDGRSSSSNDKIQETSIRPIYQDEETYTIHHEVTYSADADETDVSNALLDAALRSRENYMGSGSPSFYATVGVINDMLLAKDKMGRRLYSTVSELADAMRVKEIVEVPIMEGATRSADSKNYELLGLIVNLNDYTIGADKGGPVDLFDGFDLNFNKYEYLIETRCSGALTKPYSAIALEKASTVVSG